MLGWWICIQRQLPGQSLDEAIKDKGTTLAIWETGLGGLDWIEKLVEEGKAGILKRGGYPNLYTSIAKYVLFSIASGPPAHNGPVVIGDDYFLPAGWSGKAEIDRKKIAQCPLDALLVIEAWDLS